METPPKIGSLKWSDLLDQLKVAWRYRGIGVRRVGDNSRLHGSVAAQALARPPEGGVSFMVHA